MFLDTGYEACILLGNIGIDSEQVSDLAFQLCLFYPAFGPQIFQAKVCRLVRRVGG